MLKESQRIQDRIEVKESYAVTEDVRQFKEKIDTLHREYSQFFPHMDICHVEEFPSWKLSSHPYKLPLLCSAA
jgi:hypothetical protein